MERSEQRQRTRRRLVESTLKLSASEGFSGLSLRKVAHESGITPAAFYKHFRDMEDLGLALIDEVGISLRQLLRDARRNYAKTGTVRTSIETFMSYIEENPNLFRLLLGERQGSSSQFRRALYAEIDRFVGELTEDLERVAREHKQPIESALAAEAVVAVAFTVGAEALDLPKHRRVEIAERLIKEVKIILRGAQIRSEPSPKASKNRS